MFVHPLADVIPEMTSDQYEELRDDISRHGLLEPIVLLDGSILDGRHRQRACDELGVEPTYVQFTGASPVEFVVSKNLRRRHLTASQRAATAIAFLPELEKEARARQQAAGRHSGRGLNSSAPMGADLSNGHRAADYAAELVGVSGRSVQRAKRVAEEAPEVFEQVKAGAVSIRAAEDAIREAEPPRPRRVGRSPENVANAARDRISTAMHTLNGMCIGLEEVDVARACEVATRDDIDHWVRTLDRAARTMRRFKATVISEGSVPR